MFREPLMLIKIYLWAVKATILLKSLCILYPFPWMQHVVAFSESGTQSSSTLLGTRRTFVSRWRQCVTRIHRQMAFAIICDLTLEEWLFWITTNLLTQNRSIVLGVWEWVCQGKLFTGSYLGTGIYFLPRMQRHVIAIQRKSLTN